MADARADILARIRRALADRPAAPPIPRDYDLTRPVDDLLGLFAERVADYRTRVHRAEAADLPATITAVLGQRGTMVVPPDVPASWCVPDIDWLLDDEDDPLTVAALDEAAGVLTGCAVAIAETGTIVLDAGPEQGRRALTLVPDYHLCVVRAEQIVATVPEALAKLDPVRPSPSSPAPRPPATSS